jgi:phosphotriesterase-related protein
MGRQPLRQTTFQSGARHLTQLDTLVKLCERGYADRVMLSHDKASLMDWLTNAELEFAVPAWHFGYIHGGSLPGLRERGFTDDQIEQMLVHNPPAFFTGHKAAAS